MNTPLILLSVLGFVQYLWIIFLTLRLTQLEKAVIRMNEINISNWETQQKINRGVTDCLEIIADKDKPKI